MEALFEKDHGNVSDLLFEDIRIVKSNRGIGVWQRDGNGTMSDITFNNIEIETNYMIMPQFWGSAGSYTLINIYSRVYIYMYIYIHTRYAFADLAHFGCTCS